MGLRRILFSLSHSHLNSMLPYDWWTNILLLSDLLICLLFFTCLVGYFLCGWSQLEVAARGPAKARQGITKTTPKVLYSYSYWITLGLMYEWSEHVRMVEDIVMPFRIFSMN